MRPIGWTCVSVARVVRALTFDAKGKPGYSPVSDAWNIRNYDV